MWPPHPLNNRNHCRPPSTLPSLPEQRGTCFRCFGNTDDWMNASAIKASTAGSVKVLARAGEDLGEGERSNKICSKKGRQMAVCKDRRWLARSQPDRQPTLANPALTKLSSGRKLHGQPDALKTDAKKTTVPGRQPAVYRILKYWQGDFAPVRVSRVR